jgi:hypothetical protein
MSRKEEAEESAYPCGGFLRFGESGCWLGAIIDMRSPELLTGSDTTSQEFPNI